MLVTTTTFFKYLGASKTDTELATMYLQSAQDIVSRELGYDVETTEYTETYHGNSLNTIILSAFNVSVTSFTINGDSTIPYHVIDNILYIDDLNKTYGPHDVIAITYYGGWDSDLVAGGDTGTGDYAPAGIKNCILQIATLKSKEESGNIGFTSQIVGDGGGSTRTFQNTTNFGKYFPQIRSYKVLNLMR